MLTLFRRFAIMVIPAIRKALREQYQNHPTACKVSVVVSSIVFFSLSLSLSIYVVYGLFSGTLGLSSQLYYSMSACSLAWIGCRLVRMYLKRSSEHLPPEQQFDRKHSKVLQIAAIALFFITLLASCYTSYLIGNALFTGNSIELGLFSATCACMWVCIKTFKYRKKLLFEHKLHREGEELKNVATSEGLKKDVAFSRFKVAHTKFVKVTTCAVCALALIASLFVFIEFFSLLIGGASFFTVRIFSMGFTAVIDLDISMSAFDKMKKMRKVEKDKKNSLLLQNSY